MFVWIVSIAVGLIAYGFWKMINKPVQRSLSGRAARLDDRLQEYDGAYGADKLLGPAAQESIARTFERMCVLEPSRWVGDPNLPEVIRRYKAIVSGKEKDPEGRHVPSMTLLGQPNPDYERYLRNQRKTAPDAESAKVAGKWARKALREQKIRDGFDDVLRKMGMPESLIGKAITEYRLDHYTERQWREVVAACRRMAEGHSEEFAGHMLDLFDEAEVLCDEDAAETFGALEEQDVPDEVSVQVVKGQISMEQAEKAAKLVEEWGYNWGEATAEVLDGDRRSEEDTRLRSLYRAKTGGRKATPAQGV